MIPFGSVGISHAKTTLFGRAVKFFTGGPSHSFVIAEPIGAYDTVFEATTLAQVVPFDRNYRGNPKEDYALFECVAASDSRKRMALRFVFWELSGTWYGYLQILWFVLDWFAQFFGFGQFPMPAAFRSGTICSELLYLYLLALGGDYADAVAHLKRETTAPEHLRQVILSRPDLFRYLEHQGNKEWLES